MDNPGFQNDGEALSKSTKKPLSRANSVLMPTNKSWHLTQATRPKLCRCNSLLVPKKCCLDEFGNKINNDPATNRPFFSKKSPPRIQTPLYTKWSDSFTRLYDCDTDFQKFTNESPSKSVISTIYEPQFLASEHSYSGWNRSKHIGDNTNTHAELKKEWWPGGWQLQFVNSRRVSSSQKIATIICALVLTLLASGNIIYILQTVQPSTLGQNKSAWIDVVLITGEFRITNEQFRPSLSNNTSEDFQSLGGLISQQLDNLFTLSSISEPYHSTSVTDFSPGLVVHLQMVLKTSDDITSSKVGMAFLRGLYHHHNQVWLGNFSVDIQSIGFLATNDGIIWSDWSGWSNCHFASDVGYIHTRTRNCSLYSGRYLYSTLPCLLIPHSHGNIESAPCKPQEIVSLKSDYRIDDEESSTIEDNMTNTTENIMLNIVTILSSVDVNNTNKYGNDSMTNDIDSTVRSNNNVTESFLNNSTDPTTTVVPIVKADETVIIHKVYGKPCACDEKEVCVALVDELVPHCVKMIDPTDPTGCGGHCKLNVEICQRIRGNAYRCLDDSKCLKDEWQCGNQLCIPQEKRCDGHFNCYDHTDEFNCECNLTTHFHCGNRMSCLPIFKRCDAVVDCWDAADELNCTTHCLGTEQFTCNDSQCIPNHRFCDGFPDCRDQSDEPFGCGGECNRHEWKCSNKRCIAKAGLCDGIDDCGDESDEADCPQVERH